MASFDKYFLIILIILSFLFQISLAFLSPVKYWDETVYANLGKNLVRFGEYSFGHGFSDFYPNMPNGGARPPLIPFLAAFVYLFTSEIFWLNFIGPILNIFGVIGIFSLTMRFFNKETAYYSSVLFAFFPMNVFWSSKLLTDSALLTFLIFASYFFLISFYRKENQFFSSIFFWCFSCPSFFDSLFSYLVLSDSFFMVCL